MLKTNRVATICIHPPSVGLAAARDRFLEAWRTGECQGEYFGFESPAALFRIITPKRWELLAKLQQTGPVSVRALARELERDFRRVHDHVTAVIKISLVEKTAGRAVWVPFKEIRTSFVLRREF